MPKLIENAPDWADTADREYIRGDRTVRAIFILIGLGLAGAAWVALARVIGII